MSLGLWLWLRLLGLPRGFLAAAVEDGGREHDQAPKSQKRYRGGGPGAWSRVFLFLLLLAENAAHLHALHVDVSLHYLGEDPLQLLCVASVRHTRSSRQSCHLLWSCLHGKVDLRVGLEHGIG